MPHTQEYTPTQLKKNSSDVFNSVQSGSEVLIISKTRPNMVIMLESDVIDLNEKIFQLTKMIKKMDGDAYKQKDLLK